MTPARAVNLHAEPHDVYIGRGSPWGNPYTHRKGTQATTIVATRDEAIERYRADLWRRLRVGEPELVERLAELHGKRLGCYCKPKACHGDVLARAAAWANERLLLAEVEQLIRDGILIETSRDR